MQISFVDGSWVIYRGFVALSLYERRQCAGTPVVVRADQVAADFEFIGFPD
jgi:hypothetical protein